MNSAALLLIPLAGLLAWITHASLTLSGSGPRWARWGARWGCLGLVPLACVATWVWRYYFVPPATDTHIYALRDIDVYPLVSIFFGLLAWVVFLALEPLVSWLGSGGRSGWHCHRFDPWPQWVYVSPGMRAVGPNQAGRPGSLCR